MESFNVQIVQCEACEEGASKTLEKTGVLAGSNSKCENGGNSPQTFLRSAVHSCFEQVIALGNLEGAEFRAETKRRKQLGCVTQACSRNWVVWREG